MQVQWIEIERLVLYERNAKQHPDEQVEKIVNSISNFGWDQPIVVDEEMVIIKGHGRYFAAEKLELDQAPVVVRDDLTEDQKRAARLADNRSAESAWDWAFVKVELENISDTDIEITGFSDDEIQGLFEDPDIVFNEMAENSESGGHTPLNSLSFWIYDCKLTDNRDETYNFIMENIDKIREMDQKAVINAILEGLHGILD